MKEGRKEERKRKAARIDEGRCGRYVHEAKAAEAFPKTAKSVWLVSDSGGWGL